MPWHIYILYNFIFFVIFIFSETKMRAPVPGESTNQEKPPNKSHYSITYHDHEKRMVAHVGDFSLIARCNGGSVMLFEEIPNGVKIHTGLWGFNTAEFQHRQKFIRVHQELLEKVKSVSDNIRYIGDAGFIFYKKGDQRWYICKDTQISSFIKLKYLNIPNPYFQSYVRPTYEWTADERRYAAWCAVLDEYKQRVSCIEEKTFYTPVLYCGSVMLPQPKLNIYSFKYVIDSGIPRVQPRCHLEAFHEKKQYMEIKKKMHVELKETVKSEISGQNLVFYHNKNGKTCNLEMARYIYNLKNMKYTLIPNPCSRSAEKEKSKRVISDLWPLRPIEIQMAKIQKMHEEYHQKVVWNEQIQCVAFGNRPVFVSENYVRNFVKKCDVMARVGAFPMCHKWPVPFEPIYVSRLFNGYDELMKKMKVLV